ncbi:hypothetical protein HPP92_023751 [Vanilla planifolia]|uniref:Cyclin delta-3 n=1 Tax=Vanilla planifolia TaxID=51239 RepID=A0A835PNK3_VANPL|nr:hypothetical protein HPP92_024094 [Vanilla planifolia]KAG0455963.1 hypothetical protein HPP92_023751 [Vanilla planifolia]
MRFGVGLFYRAPFAYALPTRCSRASSILCLSSRSVVSVSNPSYLDHVSFIRDVATINPPERLNCLINILQARGESIVSPGAKEGLIPLVIPLSKNSSGALTSLLRWPTSPTGMEAPVVEVKSHGVLFLAKSVDQYICRLLAEEDAKGLHRNNEKLWEVADSVGKELYRKGGFLESGIADLDVYLLKKVGVFPDVLERKIACYLEKGDYVSALVTGEFYTRNHFLGFGRPFVFNAEILLKVGRKSEAKDAARGALKSPWWTLGCRYQEVAAIAGWDDEQIEYIKEKISEEGRKEDLKKGKLPEQVALDEAAFLLDLASIDGSWDAVVDRVAECYIVAGLPDVAKFVKCKG